MEHTEKTRLLDLLKTECTSDMVEQIMEWSTRDLADNLTETEAHEIMDQLRVYQKEGITIQGGDIQEWNLKITTIEQFEEELKDFIINHRYVIQEDADPQINDNPQGDNVTIDLHTVDGEYERIRISIDYIA